MKLERGFTLVELLVVIGIIALLISVASKSGGITPDSNHRVRWASTYLDSGGNAQPWTYFSYPLPPK